MMVPLGLWLGIIGYAVLYSGVIKLGGGKCSLAQSFRGQCVPSTAAKATSAGSTQAASAQASAAQQLSGIPSIPIGMA